MWDLFRRTATNVKSATASKVSGKRHGGPWARPLAVMAWWSFVLALISGMVLSFHYRPWGDVFSHLSKLTGWIPYGDFFRRLHYLSGQSFLLLTIFHTFEHFFRRSYNRTRATDWSRLVVTFALGFFLVFTGFIMKGDLEGIHAGQIMAHLAAEVPVIGATLSRLLIRPGDDFFLLPTLYHTVIVPVIMIFLLHPHRRRRLSQISPWALLLTAALVLVAPFFPMPPDIPPHTQVETVSGPWFFHGVQLLLRQGPPFWVGVVWPLVPMALLIGLSWVPSGMRRIVWWITAVSWLAHGVCMVAGWIVFSRIFGGVVG